MSSRDIRSMMMPKHEAEAIDKKRRAKEEEEEEEDDSSSSSSSSSSSEEEKRRKKKDKKKDKKKKKVVKKAKKRDSSSSSSDSEAELRRKFEREAVEEREAERKAEVLDTDGEGDDEGDRFEQKLRKNKEVRNVNGREVLTVAPGSDALFVVSDDHLSEGEDDAVDHDFYAASVAAERLERSSRRRKLGDERDRRAQDILERYAQRELAELQRDRRIAESSSFAGSDTAASPTTPAAQQDPMLRRQHDKAYYKQLNDEQLFLLWAEIPVIQLLNDRAWKRMKDDPAFKHSVRTQTIFQKRLNELANRARKAIRGVDSADLTRWEAAVQGVLAPARGREENRFEWDEQSATDEAALVCSFTGDRVASAGIVHVLTIDGARYATPHFSYAARLDSLAKFCDIYRHIGNAARVRLGELALPDSADMADRLEALFADPAWTAELRAIYTYGTRVCNAVIAKYEKKN